MGWQRYPEVPWRGHGAGPCACEAPALCFFRLVTLDGGDILDCSVLQVGLDGQALRAGWVADKGRKQETYLDVSRCQYRGLVGHRE